MSDIRKGREELLKLADDLKKINKPATAKHIISIVDTYLMRAHTGKPQGPKSVKRASKKAAAKKTPAKKPAAKKPAAKKPTKKAPAKKKSPAKKATVAPASGGQAPETHASA